MLELILLLTVATTPEPPASLVAVGAVPITASEAHAIRGESMRGTLDTLRSVGKAVNTAAKAAWHVDRSQRLGLPLIQAGPRIYRK